MIFLVEAFEVAAVKCFADLRHKLVIEIKVVLYRKHHTNRFLRFNKVADIRTAMMTASRTSAVFVNRSGVTSVLLVHDVYLAVPCEHITVTRISGRHYAVKEVNTHVYCLKNVLRSTNTHKISGLIYRHERLYRVNDSVHFLSLFTYCKTADSISVEIHFCDLMHMLDSEILVCATLVDSKKHLLLVDCIGKAVESSHLILTALEPSCSSFARLLCVLIFRRVFDTLVECHCDSRRKIGLDLHTFLRSHKNTSAVNMRSKVYALFLDTAKLGK